MLVYGLKSTSSHALFSITILYTEFFLHDNPIKKFSQCKVDFSFSYMEQYKNNYILYLGASLFEHYSLIVTPYSLIAQRSKSQYLQ